MSTILAGITGPKWGTTDETAFYISNISETTTGDDSFLENGQGDRVNLATEQSMYELEMDFEVLASATAPGRALRGHTITFTDTEYAGTYYVREVVRSRQKKQWMTGRIRAVQVTTALFASSTTSTTTTTTTTT